MSSNQPSEKSPNSNESPNLSHSNQIKPIRKIFGLTREERQEVRENRRKMREERIQARFNKQKLRQLDQLARKKARQEKLQKRRELQQNFQNQKQSIIKDQTAHLADQSDAISSKEKELLDEQIQLKGRMKEERQKNRRLSRIRSQRRTSRFLKFSNRLWWRSYLTIIGWIFLIFITIVGIFYLLKAVGLNVLDLIR